MKIRLTLLLGVCATIIFAAPPMNNTDIVKMVQSGITNDAILAAINGCEPHFGLTPGETLWLSRSGVSDDLIKAMAARQHGTPLPVPVVPAPAAVVEPVITPVPADLPSSHIGPPTQAKEQLERPHRFGLSRWQPEFGIGTGAIVYERGTTANTISIEGNIGVAPRMSITGIVSRDSDISLMGPFGMKGTTILFGPKASFFNRTRFTPHVSLLVGGYRASLRYYNTSVPVATTAAFGLGFGLDVHVNRVFGFRVNATGIKPTGTVPDGSGDEYGVQGRSSFGVFFRFGS